MRRILVAVINFYQKWISPAFPARCKYYPSCSSYAASAISNYGLRGVGMSLWRLVRCNPWSHGGVDYAVKPVKNLGNTFKTNQKTSVGVN
ncbi:membrane protein insertion efficiency factor YidD [Actinobacteria bacterium IMCC26103]|nr:membrane protein insertion efficiency factor YidD [Actinobacteria bacterium IMCC26103]